MAATSPTLTRGGGQAPSWRHSGGHGGINDVGNTRGGLPGQDGPVVAGQGVDTNLGLVLADLKPRTGEERN